MQNLCTRGIYLSLQHGTSKSCRILHHYHGGYRSVRKCHQISPCGFINRHFKPKIIPAASVLPASFRSTLNCVRTYSQANKKPQAQSTIDEEEIDKFRALSERWWDEIGEFQALHTLNDLRVPLIRDATLNGRDHKDERLALEMGPSPLKETLILDVGSGGGILAEPLARLGATVIGIDATEENIPIAQTHASHDPEIRTRLKYIHGTTDDLVATEAGMFDVVVASEVLEHVSDVGQLVSTCVDLVRPGGSVIFTTINKTWISYMLAVVGAEDIFRVVPSGTHDWEKFIPPEDLERILEQCGCEVKLVSGMLYNPLTHHWSWTDIESCNYALHAIKPEKQTTTERGEPEEQVQDVTDSSEKR
ncbi:ubiquinone biosynthesis O-methyltransferase-like [Amphiura filiformis]|uniref:ubiquinone biosynthesis O-methyltransferase-like n=1 Tax=Amphiura filiformis TaxID=82378 RepID=UPI003B21857A